MRLIFFRAVAIIAVLLVSTTLAACDQSGKAVKTDKATERKVKASREGDKIKITGEQGEIVIDPDGGELPEHWPEDFPTFPKAKITNTVEGAGAANMIMVVFETGKAVQDVKDFYKEELPKSGWEITNEVEAGEAFILAAAKDARAASVSISKNTAPDTTIISINVAAR